MKPTLALAIIFTLCAALAYMVLDLNFGVPAHTETDDYIIKNTQRQTATNNAVTAVVFDWRGIDTLGEATVLFTAVLGVGMLFRKLRDDEEYAND